MGSLENAVLQSRRAFQGQWIWASLFFVVQNVEPGTMPIQPGDNMGKIVILCVSLIACLGCGGKQNLENQISSLKQDLTDCQYAIDDQKSKQRELRMEALPKEAKRPPSPKYVGPWHRAFSALVPRVREVMGDREFDVGFRNGALVIFLPASGFFAVGGKKLTQNGQETVDALLEILSEEQQRDVVVAVRSAELSKLGIGKRGNLDAQASVRFNRALSIYRAMEITNAIEDGGIDPLSVIPAARAVDPDEENPPEDGMVEIALQPVGEEIPDFPEPGKGRGSNESEERRGDFSDPDFEDLE
jgi:hypothetical protein